MEQALFNAMHIAHGHTLPGHASSFSSSKNCAMSSRKRCVPSSR
jgi:hypothetical protein